MGNLCTQNGSTHSNGQGPPQSNMLSRSYYDSLYGPSNVPHPSPYHPYSGQPVRVPKLFDLALEQLCVSLVDQQALEQVLIQQQRKRRGSLRAAESDGGSMISMNSPTPPTAAAIWASTPPVEQGYNGATRRYSHTDAYPPPMYLVKSSPLKSKEKGKNSPVSTGFSVPRSPFHAHNVLLHSPIMGSGTNNNSGLVTPPLKRGRSLSLSSKESPELQPQLYQAANGLGGSQRMLIAPGSSSSTSLGRRDSTTASSVGSSPLQTSFGGKSIPASPLWLGSSALSTHVTTPNSHHTNSYPVGSPSTMSPPFIRSASSPKPNTHPTPHSQPHPPTHSWIDPPELLLGPTSRLNLGVQNPAPNGGRFRSASEVGHESDGDHLSTSTLLTSGSMGVGGWTTNGFNIIRQLRLPDSIIQLIFDRLIAEELLTSTNIHLFTNSNLSRMDFSGTSGKVLEESTNINCANTCSKYSQELTDEWLHVLFENIIRHHHTLQTLIQQSLDKGLKHKFQTGSLTTPPSPILTGINPPIPLKHVSPPTATSSSSSTSSSSASPGPILACVSPTSLRPVVIPAIELSNLSLASPPLLFTPKRSTFPSIPAPHRVNMNEEEEMSHDPTDTHLPHWHPDESEESKSIESSHLLTPKRQPGEQGAILTNMRQENKQPGGTEIAAGSLTTSPRLVPNSSSPHHGSITSLSLERQASVNKANATDGHSNTTSPTRSVSSTTPPTVDQATDSMLQALASLSPIPHRVDPLPQPHTPIAFNSPLGSLPTLHNPLSVTSPSPSLALYRHAPSLTSLNLSGCFQITNRSLQPLQVCLMLTELNLNHCTQISDELLICVLQNKFYFEELQLKGLKGVTDDTLQVLGDKLKLRKLYLDSASITDTGLVALSSLSHLQHFSVGWCGKRVTDRGLAWLAHNFRLQTLCLAFTGIQTLQFFGRLRFLKEINIAGCKIHEPGLKTPNVFPHLLHAYMHRTGFREIPPAFLHHGLHSLDMSFSSMVASGKLLFQFQNWAQAKPINVNVPPIAPGGMNMDEIFVDEIDMGNFDVDSGGSVLKERDYEARKISSAHSHNSAVGSASSSSFLSSVLGDHEYSTSPFSTSVGSSPPLHPLTHSPPPILNSTNSAIQLRTLILESCSVDNRVASVIGEHFINLTDLNISDTDVTSDGLLALAPLKRLRSLNFSGCKILNHSLAVLANFKILQELYADCPSITDAGLAFLRCLSPTLTRLDVFETAITEVGLEHILVLRKLVFLELCSGRLTNAGLAKITAHLKYLTSLNVSQNRHINDTGLDCLRSLKNLVHLNLSGTGVTHKGLAFLQPKPTDGNSSTSNAATSNPFIFNSESPIKHLSLFGCEVKATSTKIKDLPCGIQLGIDAGIVSIE